MTRPEAGNLLMVGAGVISALHTALFGIWVSAIGSDKELADVARGIAIAGAVLMLLNAAAWLLCRQRFQRRLAETEDGERLDATMTMGLMVPFLAILSGWVLCIFRSCSVE